LVCFAYQPTLQELKVINSNNRRFTDKIAFSILVTVI